MRILVTGADGFIGSKLVKKLENEGHDVVCHTLKDGDISDKNVLNKYKNIEHVYHLAARTFVPGSWENTHDYFQTNVMGTITVLEFCRQSNCSATVMSTYVYGEPQYLPIDENHPVVGVSPYHESKIMVEALCKFYCDKFGISVNVFRPFNVYGEGQSDEFLIPKILLQVLDENIKEIKVMDLEPKRDYIYIKDVITVLVLALCNENKYEVYNIGTGMSVSVRNVIELIMEITGIYKPVSSECEKRTNEISNSVASTKKLKFKFGYLPQYSLKEGLEDWILNKKNLETFTVKNNF